MQILNIQQHYRYCITSQLSRVTKSLSARSLYGRFNPETCVGQLAARMTVLLPDLEYRPLAGPASSRPDSANLDQLLCSVSSAWGRMGARMIKVTLLLSIWLLQLTWLCLTYSSLSLTQSLMHNSS